MNDNSILEEFILNGFCHKLRYTFFTNSNFILCLKQLIFFFRSVSTLYCLCASASEPKVQKAETERQKKHLQTKSFSSSLLNPLLVGEQAVISAPVLCERMTQERTLFNTHARVLLSRCVCVIAYNVMHMCVFVHVRGGVYVCVILV